MPVLKDFRGTISISLPETGGKVELYDCLIANDSLEIEKIYTTDTSVPIVAGQTSTAMSIRASRYYEAQEATLKVMVKGWDFTDKDGKDIKPTVENIKKLPRKDYDFLVQKVTDLTGEKRLTTDQKKN